MTDAAQFRTRLVVLLGLSVGCGPDLGGAPGSSTGVEDGGETDGSWPMCLPTDVSELVCADQDGCVLAGDGSENTQGEVYFCMASVNGSCGECSASDECMAEAERVFNPIASCGAIFMEQSCGAMVSDEGECCYRATIESACCSCTAGRPFICEGALRSAEPVARRDWSAQESSAPAPVESAVAEMLGRHWLEVAAMEHASVASFARFTLEAMTLGAPPEILSDAQAAGLDEVEHARLAYAMASAYLDRDLGPGALPMQGVQLRTDPRTIVTSAFIEACVHETFAALEASRAARHAHDPHVASVLSRIADDESRHAELGWRFVAWALRDDASLRAAVVEAFHTLRPDALVGDVDTNVDGQPSLAPHGILDPTERQALAQTVLDEVIAPCLGAMLQDGTTHRSAPTHV